MTTERAAEVNEMLWAPLRGIPESGQLPVFKNQLQGVVDDLERHISEDGRPIHLPHTTLAPEGAAELAHKLGNPVVLDQALRRVVDASRSAGGETATHPVRSIVKAKLIIVSQVAKLLIDEDVDALLLYLAREVLADESTVEADTEVPEKILCFEQLDSAMIQVDRAYNVNGSIAQQITNHFRLARTGIVVTPHAGPQHDFDLAQVLLDVLVDLKHPESAAVLEEWIVENIFDNKEELTLLLEALVNMTALLDSRALVELYATGEDQIPVLPFQTLYGGVLNAIQYLREINQEDSTGPLLDIKQTILLRYGQIVTGQLGGEVVPSSALTPNKQDLALRFLEWLENVNEVGNSKDNLTNQQAAQHIARLLEQTGVTQLEDFCIEIAEFNPVLADTIKRECVRLNIMADNKIAAEVRRETLDALITYPFLDAADIDFSTLIPAGTEHLELIVVTGTFVATKGHGELFEKLEAYMDHLDELDRQKDGETSVHRMLLVLPFTGTEVPAHQSKINYKKEYAKVGSTYERAASLMLLLANSSRDRLFMTTELQPDPENAGKVHTSIKATVQRFAAKVNADYGTSGRIQTFDVSYRVAVGSDELEWDGTHIARGTQPRKVTNAGKGAVVVGRHGDLVNLVRNAHDFEALLPHADFVITPGTPHTSSTRGINLLKEGNSPIFTTPCMPFMSAHYSPEAQEQRERIGPNSHTPIPSITEICQTLIKEYEKMV